MRFWDSSAIVPLLLEEKSSASLKRHVADDDRLVVWWATPVECLSALVRARVAGRIRDEHEAVGRLDWMEKRWREIDPARGVREGAKRMLRVHAGLRSADAFQLAAAVAAAEGKPETLAFVCLDDRLRAAAAREGFPVLS